MADDSNTGRFAVIGISSLILVAMVVAVTVGVHENVETEDLTGKNRKSTKQVSASVKAIKSICQPADYKQTCEKSLAKSAGNKTDPKELIKLAFKLTEQKIAEASKKSVSLQEFEKDPRTKEALISCNELMHMSIDELHRSFEKVSGFDITLSDGLMADLRTWLSAAITYEETCIDAFENTTSDAGAKMKIALKTAMEMSSNALDIIDGLSSILTDLQTSEVSRRLLQQPADEEDEGLGHDDESSGFPAWVGSGTRKLLATPTLKITPNLTVAKDGTGDFKTINEALHRIPKSKRNVTFVLYIKGGVYNEIVEFNKSMDNLIVIGDGQEKTRITGNKNFVDGFNTYRTATVVVRGDKFLAKNIGFENSAGASKHQAVALRVSADFAIFYNCSMDGYQDTLYSHAKRQFYHSCTISGTIDFVFGDASVVFQNCKFLIRKPLTNQHCTVTAQGRKQRRQPTAIVIQNGTIKPHSEMVSVKNKFKSYLGRQWKQYSRTVVMESYIDDVIQAEGWLHWDGAFGQTCWYGEYNNLGPGSETKSRVRWHGIKNISQRQAIDFTPGRFLLSNIWIKPTKIPYTPYLTRK